MTRNRAQTSQIPQASKTAAKPPREAGDAAPATASARADIDAFVRRARALAAQRPAGVRGRLVFAMDATMSRQPTWDAACHIQAQMFREAGGIGGLEVQLVYFRGFNECRASRWVSDAEGLARLMTGIDCRGGRTQIGKVLAHARKEAAKARISALVYVGDAMEEDIDHLCHLAGELGLLSVPAFMFQEGHVPGVEQAYREIARLTRGAYCRFDHGSADQLRALLSAVAIYAAGGRAALENHSASSRPGRLLLEQMKR